MDGTKVRGRGKQRMRSSERDKFPPHRPAYGCDGRPQERPAAARKRLAARLFGTTEVVP
jgi:hypothetical protein